MEHGLLRFEEIPGGGLMLTGAAEEVRDLVVPDAVQGKRVLAVASHAFAGNNTLRYVSLPESIHTIGSFAFHNCKSLTKIELHDSVTDYGDGAIRQCTALSDVHIVMHGANHEAVVRMLSDCDNTLTFALDYPEGKALLTFPGYVYDFTENTMARTIQFNIEGSGMAFRDCVSRTGIDFAAYDRLFHRAKLDDIAVTVRLVLNRLMTPYALSEQAKAMYETYVKDKAEKVLTTLVEQKDREGIRFLASENNRHLLNPAATGAALLLASQKGLVEIGAILTEGMSSAEHASRRGALCL